MEVLAPRLLATLLLGAAVAWLRRARYPLFDLSSFGGAQFSCALLVILLGYFAFSRVSFVVAQHLQLGRAKGAVEADLLTHPLPFSMLLGTHTAPHLMARRQWGWPRSAAVMQTGSSQC